MIPPYLSALRRELTTCRSAINVKTIYIGGGTPTALSTDELESLLKMLRDELELSELEEFTVEANPGTVDERKLSALRAGGVNRLSIGVQSFNRHVLKTLGRIHDDAEAVRVIELARRTGFDNVSIDLIFAVPGQTVQNVRADIDRTASLNVEHVSAYGLTFEEGTPLWSDRQSGRVKEVPEEIQLTMYRTVRKCLSEAGFEHYEISSFARPGRRSIHNQVYWRNDPYVGIGAAAATCLDGRRSVNVRDILSYISGVSRVGRAVGESEELDARKRAGETIMLGLRRTEGISEQEFASRTGFTLQELAGPALQQFETLGLVSTEGGRLKLTDRGMEVGETVLCELL